MATALALEFEKPIAELERQIEDLKRLASQRSLDVAREIAPLEAKLAELRTEIYRNLTHYQRVQVARHPRRPYSLDYINGLFAEFIELHGDRLYRDDPAIVGGLGRLNGRSVVVIGQQKGRDIKENLKRNFGMPHPEGYRKALRLMRLAERFRLPIVTLIDTPGAHPGLGAEERGQAEAIARNLREMARLPVPSCFSVYLRPLAVVMTLAPMCLASWMAKPATPPAPPWIRMVSPALSRAVSSMAVNAVRLTSPSAAASAWLSDAGFLATIPALMAIFSA
jgi:acetyl-CoA carboxylase carboxyl transferase alpha subunit